MDPVRPTTCPTLRIDPEFEHVAWPLTAEETAELTASLRQEGCHSPVIYWQQPDVPQYECILLDGHHRYRICHEHAIPFPVKGLPFRNREAAINWAILAQLGRRNASIRQQEYLRGKLKNLLASQPTPPGEHRPNIAKTVAEVTGATERQVYKDAVLAKAIDRLAEHAPALRDAVMQRTLTRADGMVLGAESDETLQQLQADISAGAPLKEAVSRVFRATDTRPIYAIKELAELDACLGRLIRAKTAALEACGGRTNHLALKHETALREVLNEAARHILEWQKAFDIRKHK
mgnify:CR=1 FL=1